MQGFDISILIRVVQTGPSWSHTPQGRMGRAKLRWPLPPLRRADRADGASALASRRVL